MLFFVFFLVLIVLFVWCDGLDEFSFQRSELRVLGQGPFLLSLYSRYNEGDGLTVRVDFVEHEQTVSPGHKLLIGVDAWSDSGGHLEPHLTANTWDFAAEVDLGSVDAPTVRLVWPHDSSRSGAPYSYAESLSPSVWRDVDQLAAVVVRFGADVFTGAAARHGVAAAAKDVRVTAAVVADGGTAPVDQFLKDANGDGYSCGQALESSVSASLGAIAWLSTPLDRTAAVQTRLNRWSDALDRLNELVDAADSSNPLPWVALAADGLTLSLVCQSHAAGDVAEKFLGLVHRRSGTRRAVLLSSGATGAPFSALSAFSFDNSVSPLHWSLRLFNEQAERWCGGNGAVAHNTSLLFPPGSSVVPRHLAAALAAEGRDATTLLLLDNGLSNDLRPIRLGGTGLRGVPYRSSWRSYGELRNLLREQALRQINHSQGQPSSLIPSLVLECALEYCAPGVFRFLSWALHQPWIQFDGPAHWSASAAAAGGADESVSQIWDIADGAATALTARCLQEGGRNGAWQGAAAPPRAQDDAELAPWLQWLDQKVGALPLHAIENWQAPADISLATVTRRAATLLEGAVHGAPGLHRLAAWALLTAVANGAAAPWQEPGLFPVYTGVTGSGARVGEQTEAADGVSSSHLQPVFPDSVQQMFTPSPHQAHLSSDPTQIAAAQLASASDTLVVAFAAWWSAHHGQCDKAATDSNDRLPFAAGQTTAFTYDVDGDGVLDYVLQTDRVLAIVDRWGARLRWAFVRERQSCDAVLAVGALGGRGDAVAWHVEVSNGGRRSALVSRWSSGKNWASYANMDFGLGAPEPIVGTQGPQQQQQQHGFQFRSVDGGLVVRILLADDVLLAEYKADAEVGVVEQWHSLSLTRWAWAAPVGRSNGASGPVAVVPMAQPAQFSASPVQIQGYRIVGSDIGVAVVGLRGVQLLAAGSVHGSDPGLPLVGRVVSRQSDGLADGKSARRRWALALAFSVSSAHRLATGGTSALPEPIRQLHTDQRHFARGGAQRTARAAQEAAGSLAPGAVEPAWGDLQRRPRPGGSAGRHPFRSLVGQAVLHEVAGLDADAALAFARSSGLDDASHQHLQSINLKPGHVVAGDLPAQPESSTSRADVSGDPFLFIFSVVVGFTCLIVTIVLCK